MTLELIDRLGVRAPFRRGAMLLHPECPIEQAVTSSDPVVQDSLLRGIWRRTPAYELCSRSFYDAICLAASHQPM